AVEAEKVPSGMGRGRAGPQLVLPRSAERGRYLGARRHSLHVENAERALLALELRWRQLLELEAARELCGGRFADQNLTRRSNAAEPRTGVRSVSDHRVGERLGAADVAGDQRPGVDPDPNGQRRLVHLDPLAVETTEDFELLQSAAHAAQRVVWMRDRRTPQRHDAVAHELVERPFVLEQRLDHLLEVLVEHLDDALGGRAFAHAREPADVGVEDGALLHQLPALFHLELARQDTLGDVWRQQP